MRTIRSRTALGAFGLVTPRPALAVLAVAIGVVVLTACSSPTTQGQPKGEATSTEQPSPEQAAPSAAQSAVATTEHDNYVILKEAPGGCVQSVQFIPMDANITGGQPWGGISTSSPYTPGGSLELNAKAGRHDSPVPAQWFNDRAPVNISQNNNPIKNLNFAFTGELIINGDTYIIAFGQGNQGSGQSPWFVGGQGFRGPFRYNESAIQTPDGKYQLSWNIKDDTTNQFELAATDCVQGGLTTEIHSNMMLMDVEAGGNLTGAFTWSNQYSITDGQPWEGVTTGPGGSFPGEFQITAQAGRHGSSGPAQWFLSQAQTMIGGDTWEARVPSDLNFAFSGLLTMTCSSAPCGSAPVGISNYPIVIGQGSTGTNNNWWIGGPGWTTAVCPQSPFQDVGQSQMCMNSPDGSYLMMAGESEFTFGIASNQ